MLAADAPASVITIFWLVVGTVIILWVQRDLKADRGNLDAVADALESALRRNLAEEYHIRSSGFVEFDEIEDEGACYAFQLEGSAGVIFLSGQEFYEVARFPSLDFSLVFPLNEAGGRVDMLIEKRGAKARPVRRVPASAKCDLRFPEDLRIVPATLDNLEAFLRVRISGPDAISAGGANR